MMHSEHRKAQIRQKLSYLSKTIAKLPSSASPRKVDKEIRKTIFSELSLLLDHLPTPFWSQFNMFNRLYTRLKRYTKQYCSKHLIDNINADLKKHKLLSDYTYAYTLAIFCSPTHQSWTIEKEQKYYKYKSLLLMSCLQLYVVGQHDSAIKNALREIRLIATDLNHSPLLMLLPDLPTTITVKELLSELRLLRTQDPPPSNKLLMRGLGYFYVVINDANKKAKGILRNRERKYSPKQEEIIELCIQEPTNDTDQRIFELTATPKKPNLNFDNTDEPLSIKSNKVIRVEEPSSPHRAQMLRAVQSKRFAEQLSIRQQSLPCDFEQASEWDIQHLVTVTVNCITTNGKYADIASLLLLSLLSGRNPKQLMHWNSSFLKVIQGYPCLYLSHTVPASTQSTMVDGLLLTVRKQLIIPLPAILKDRLDHSSDNIDVLRTFIKDINKRHSTRLTLSRIVRYMDHWYINQGIDRAELALIKGDTAKKRPALSYSNLDADPIINNHKNYVETLFNLASLDAQLPKSHPTRQRLGSRLVLREGTFHNLFELISPPIPAKHSHDLDAMITFHNRYVFYVYSLLVFSTGHRDVNAPMGKVTDYNRLTQTWWISDKEIRHGLAARTVVLPPTAAHQVELYLEHLQAISLRTRFNDPVICERCQTALSGAENFLFVLSAQQESEIKAIDLYPSLLDDLFKLSHETKMPFARNWGRHHLRSQLKRLGISPEQIDGWMGHEEIGEEALGRHSSLSQNNLVQISEKIEQILKEHEIKALPGWKTH